MAPKGQLSKPEIGKPMKVFFLGESPWAECLAINGDGSWVGRIDNNLVCTNLHGLKIGDVLRFHADDSNSDFDIWVPMLLTPPKLKAV